MAIPPALRAPQGCVATLPGDERPPLRRARHAVRRRGQGEEKEGEGTGMPGPCLACPSPTWSKVR